MKNAKAAKNPNKYKLVVKECFPVDKNRLAPFFSSFPSFAVHRSHRSTVPRCKGTT